MHTDLAGEERERPWPGETTFHHADQVSEQPVVSGPHHHLLSSLCLHETDPLVVLPTLRQDSAAAEEGPSKQARSSQWSRASPRKHMRWVSVQLQLNAALLTTVAYGHIGIMLADQGEAHGMG